MAATRIFTALVTFERTAPEVDFLPPEAQGAVGYMAVSATSEDDLRDALVTDLALVGLRLLEIDEIREIDVQSLPDGLDAHLADNIRQWEPGRRTVWGKIHVYLADGEA
jgi:hypothetical protein